MLNKIFNWLVLGILIFLPWQTRLIIAPAEINGAFWEYGTISLWLIDLLILVALLFWLIKEKINFTYLLKKPSNLKVLLLGLIVILSIAVSQALMPLPALLKGVNIILAIVAGYLITQTTLSYKTLLKTFLISASLCGLLGIGQFISQEAPANTWLGLGGHDPKEPGVSVVEATASDGVNERWLRAYGSLDHPNVLGGLMAIAFLFSVWLLYNRQEREEKEIKINKSLQEIIPVLSLVISLAALLLSFSRAAWLAAFLGFIWLSTRQIIKKKNLSEMIIVMVIIIFIFGLIFSQYSHLFTARIEHNSRLEIKSSEERITGFSDSVEVMAKYYLTGTGPNSYTKALASSEGAKQPAWFYQPVHSVPLLLISEFGVFSFVWLLTCLFYLTIVFLKKNKSNKGLSISLLILIIIISLLDHWPYSLHFGPIFLGITFALIIKISRERLKEKP